MHDLVRDTWAWFGIHGLGAGCMGLVRDAWAWCWRHAWCWMHGLGAGCMGLVLEAWAWCGRHGLGAGCMGLVLDAWAWCGMVLEAWMRLTLFAVCIVKPMNMDTFGTQRKCSD